MSKLRAETIGGRADLAYILAEAPDGCLEKAAGLLGYQRIKPLADAPKHGETSKPEKKQWSADWPIYEPEARAGQTPAPISFWRLIEREEVARQTTDEFFSSEQPWAGLASKAPKRRSVCPWPELMPRLRNALAEPSLTHSPDIKALVSLTSKGEPLTALPRKYRRRWPQRLHIMEDFATRLTPLWRDQDEVTGNVARLLPLDGIGHTRLEDGLAYRTIFGTIPDRHGADKQLGAPILVISDLGVLGATPAASLLRWANFALARKAEGRACIALTPAPLSAYPAAFRMLWTLVPWEEPNRPKLSKKERAEYADRLLGLISHHMKVPPGLLRDVRRLYPEMSAVTEIDAWRSPHIASPHPVAATLLNSSKARLRAHFRKQPLEKKKEIYRLVKSWCGGDYKSVYIEAVLSLGALAADVVEPGDLAAAVEFIRDMADLADRPGAPTRLRGVGKSQVERYFCEMRARVGEAPKEIPDVSEAYDRLATVAESIERHGDYPAGYDPSVLGPTGELRKYGLCQQGGRLIALSFPAITREKHAAGGSFLAEIETSRDDLAVWSAEFWKSGAPASWATDYGADEFGPWAEFTVSGADRSPVTQRMRWIAPGSFLMGSPEDEEGRDGADTEWNEGPQHQVTLTKGYWLFDTPVTQELWTAVMGENPSRFEAPKRPVEQVSWDDTARFLAKLNALVPGLHLILPTEAQWEYACRAGTTTPNYAGHSDVAPEIAWHYENSEHQTHPVKQKRINPWGLYDMLGNVWEWCADDMREYEAGAVTDPTGSLDSARRALRGGSWYDNARGVRAAYRFAYDRENRLYYTGFRCARVRAGAEPAEPGPGRAERETAPDRRGGARLLTPYGGRGAPSVDLLSGKAFVVRSDCEILTFAPLTRPDWASAMGRDRYGLWADFTLGEVAQRMRWIGPGRFLMGSPEDEPGRWGSDSDWDEGPQHEVRLTKGYWLFDTPVTQALWSEVMGDNPSHFKDKPAHPVEQVTWNGTAQFLERINEQAPGLDLVLPTEAQWEYACRAGATSPNYAGGDKDLEDIAWFSKNSGGQTQPVATKRANAWGLYDTLGNVLEWCADDMRKYGDEAVTDPTGALDGAKRAVRGGSWNDNARNVRAANRYARDRGFRIIDPGFRCARVRP